MNYVVKENDVKDTVCDFMKFCAFIETEQPFATQKGDLSVKGCYQLNKLLHYPETNAKTTDRMDKYASISLWFAVALQAGFIARADVKGGKSVYNVTEKYADFKKMNVFSQYMLIFHIWYCYVDPEVQYNERGFTTILSSLMDSIFVQLSENGSQQWIEYNEDTSQIFNRHSQPVQIMMSHYYKTAQTLRDLGLIVFEEGERRVQYFNWPIIEKLKPTDFGVSIAKACVLKKYALFNEYADKAYLNIHWYGDDDDYDDDNEDIKNDSETEEEPFIVPFMECFPKDSVDIAAINLIMFEYDDSDNDSRIFEFMVSLGKKCYRVIRCLPEHTFEDLHLAIQEAFDFDNDHLYAFYLDGKRYSRASVNAPYGEEPPFTDEVRLKDRRLKNKQHILYLFDFGDCWQFDIVIDVKKELDVVLANPEIIKSVGNSPEQYPEYDDYDYENDADYHDE